MKVFFVSLLLLTSFIENASAQTSLQEAFDRLLVSQFKPNEPGAVVLIARRDSIMYRKAFGLANLELNVPVNDSMIFYIGSNTKQFTAVAILQLVEKGKLRLQDNLGKFVPAAPPSVASITIQQLLSQTSGIDEANEKFIKALIPEEKTGNMRELNLVAGSKWEYNNTNYSLLGYIIEKATGRTYADYITENIFKPSGMEHSSVDSRTQIIKNRASGYRNFKNRFLNSSPAGNIGASGGILSNVNDLLKWQASLRSGALLKPETLQQAFQPQQLSDGTITRYGFGWHLEDVHGSAALRHGGMVPGYTSETLYFPKEEVYVAILTNTEFSAVPITALARILAGVTIGKPYVFADMPVDKSRLKKYTGLYENSFGELLNISEEDGHLIFQRPNGARYPLGYAGGDEFFLNSNFLRVKFVEGAAGKIKSLKFSKVDIDATEWFKTDKPLLNLAAARIADSLLAAYVGRYISAAGDTVVVTRDGPNVYLKAGKEQLLMAAADSTRFFSLTSDVRIQFAEERVTKAPGLLLTRGRNRTKYTKL